jgi:hypothetical protein
VIPDEFTGGWVRVTIALGDAPPHEDMLVWWLQAASRHADLRTPLNGDGERVAFAGTTVWDQPSLSWLPALELVPSGFPDTGVVAWDGTDLLESGTTVVDGAPVPYVERWRRLPDTATPLLALSRPGGRLVRTGNLALSMVDARPAGGEFHAVAWRLDTGGWTVDHAWPSEVQAPPPPPDPGLEAGTSVVLQDRLKWFVDESQEMAETHG